MQTGAELRAIGNDMVPLYEEHTARLEARIRIHEWEGMDMMEKALVIAQRRIQIALENLQAEAQIHAAQRNTKTRK